MEISHLEEIELTLCPYTCCDQEVRFSKLSNLHAFYGGNEHPEETQLDMARMYTSHKNSNQINFIYKAYNLSLLICDTVTLSL